MITADSVTKYFGGVPAINNISFDIKQGEIVGFLGQNGAGKTTLMRILATYFSPSSGKVIIGGEDVVKSPLKVRRQIGYLPETPPLYQNMSVIDYLQFAARLKDVPQKELKRQIDQTLDECRLSDVKTRIIGTLSKGYKQRVGIAQAIVHNPAILILDEPTSGLDPVQILQVRQLIKNLEHKRTIILSTHILPEIEQMAQRVIIIKSGAIILDGQLKEILIDEQTRTSRSLEEVFLEKVRNPNEK